MKACSKCREVKDFCNFHKNKSKKDGISDRCKDCAKAITKLWASSNKEKKKESDKAYYEENKDRIAVKQRAYAASNKDHLAQKAKEYVNKNRDKVNENSRKWVQRHLDQHKETCRRWRMSNKGVVNAKTARREKRARQATPSWLTQEHLSAIIKVYEQASRMSIDTGITYHVDHIVPIQGKTVSGLHVPWNLRVIPARDNYSKGNSFDDWQPLQSV